MVMKLNKKATALFTAVIMLLSLLPLSGIAAAIGDVDGTTGISASDARLILRASVGLETLTEEQIKAADVDFDGKISAADARLVLRASVGLENLHVHEYTAQNITKQPTCTTAGVKTLTCSCGEAITQEIPATGHTPAAAVKENEKAASCSAAGGYDLVTYCSVCHAEISRERKVLAKTAHTVEIIPGTATCTEAGLSEGQKCSVCGKILIAQTEATALEHDIKPYTAPPTCTEEGYTINKCTREGCSYFTGDKTDIKAALGHNYIVTKETAATCTEAGVKHHECSRCHAVYDEITEEPIGHKKDNNWTVITAASCTQTGIRECTCLNCGEKIKEEIPATGHELTPRFVPGSCTVKNKTVRECKNCDFKSSTEFDYAHSLQIDETKSTRATCTKNGTIVKHCVLCNYETEPYTEYATGHNENTMKESKPATCTEDGWAKYGGTCTDCGEEIDETTIVMKATGHTTITNAYPTCTKGVSCTKCSELLTAPLGHDYSVKSNALGDTLGGFYCNRCGELHTNPLTVFNSLANAIKTNADFSTKNSVARISKSVMTTQYTKFDFGIYTSMIKDLYDSEMEKLVEYMPFYNNLYMRALQVPYQDYVSLLENKDIDSIKVEKVSGINTRELLSEIDDSFTVGSKTYDVSAYKNTNINRDVIKVTLDIKNETYAKNSALTNIPLEAGTKTSLSKIYELDIRNEQKEYGDDWQITDSETGDGYNISMLMTLERIDSDAQVIYYFDAETMAPIIALYNTDVVMDQGVNMNFEIGLLSLKGTIEPVIYTDYCTAYLFSEYYTAG